MVLRDLIDRVLAPANRTETVYGVGTTLEDATREAYDSLPESVNPDYVSDHPVDLTPYLDEQDIPADQTTEDLALVRIEYDSELRYYDPDLARTRRSSMPDHPVEWDMGPHPNDWPLR